MKFNFDSMLPKYDITTPLRRAAFLAQCHHESAGFTRIEENLNYSAQRLMEIFPRQFSPINSGIYAHQPQRIANRVYANRMGNGDEASGDGWLFRGRGLIQLTGRNNYAMFATYKQMGVKEIIPYLETAAGALEVACWYWKLHALNPLADIEDIINITRRINGGLMGLRERRELYRRYLAEVC